MRTRSIGFLLGCVLITAGHLFAQAAVESKAELLRDETIDGEKRFCFTVKNLTSSPGKGVWISGSTAAASNGYLDFNGTRLRSWRNSQSIIHEQRKLANGTYELLIGVPKPTKISFLYVTGYEIDGVKEIRETPCSK